MNTLQAAIIAICTWCSIATATPAVAYNGERCFTTEHSLRQVFPTTHYYWHRIGNNRKGCLFVKGDYSSSPPVTEARVNSKSLKIHLSDRPWSLQRRDSETARDFWDFGERKGYKNYELDGRWLW